MEIWNRLKQRKWDPKNEDLQRFVLVMSGIARDLGLHDTDLIKTIVENMQIAREDGNLLLNSRTMVEFKKNLATHQNYIMDNALRRSTMRFRTSGVASVPNNSAGTSESGRARPAASSGQAARPSGASVGAPAQRCYNCNRMGHTQHACPYENRERNSCFNCWQMGHGSAACPNPPKQLARKAVAAVTAGHSGEEGAANQGEISAVNLVSVRFPLSNSSNRELTKIVSLFDTGSPVSFIRRSLVPSLPLGKLEKTPLSSLGQRPLYTLGKISADILFRGQCLQQNLHVLSDDSTSIPMILGRDFLKNNNIGLFQMNNVTKEIIKIGPNHHKPNRHFSRKLEELEPTNLQVSSSVSVIGDIENGKEETKCDRQSYATGVRGGVNFQRQK